MKDVFRLIRRLLQPVQEVCRALGVGSGGEDRALVVFQRLD